MVKKKIKEYRELKNRHIIYLFNRDNKYTKKNLAITSRESEKWS